MVEQLQSELERCHPHKKMDNVHQLPQLVEASDHLQNNGGVFFEQSQPAEVVSLTPVGKPHREGQVTVEAFRAITDDGHKYLTKTFYPDIPLSPYRVHQTTPLGTHTKRGGYPYEISRKIANNGFVTTLVSAEEANLASLIGLLPGIKPGRDISIDKTVHNNLAILNYMDDFDGAVEPGRSIETGASRGGMGAIGAAAEAARFGRSVMYVDSVADCFVGDDPEIRKDIVDQIVDDEIVCVLGLMKQHNLKFLLKSTNLDPRFLANVAHIYRALEKNGQNNYLQQVPDDTFVHLTKYESDNASQCEVTEEIVSSHPNMKLDRRPGAHMSIVEKKNIALHIGRFARLREVIREGANELDKSSFDYVTDTTTPERIRQPKGLLHGVVRQIHRNGKKRIAA